MNRIRRENWCVFLSGRGSNLGALLQIPSMASIRLVVSSKAGAEGIRRARRRGIPVEILPKKTDWNEVDTLLRRHRVERIFLAGFMKVLPAEFVERWHGKIVNVHPSLLPAYAGLKSIERAYRDHADMGITVHEVIAEVDRGRRLRQQKVFSAGALPASMDEAEFWMHVCEHRLVRKVCERWPYDAGA